MIRFMVSGVLAVVSVKKKRGYDELRRMEGSEMWIREREEKGVREKVDKGVSGQVEKGVSGQVDKGLAPMTMRKVATTLLQGATGHLSALVLRNRTHSLMCRLTIYL